MNLHSKSEHNTIYVPPQIKQELLILLARASKNRWGIDTKYIIKFTKFLEKCASEETRKELNEFMTNKYGKKWRMRIDFISIDSNEIYSYVNLIEKKGFDVEPFESAKTKVYINKMSSIDIFDDEIFDMMVWLVKKSPIQFEVMDSRDLTQEIQIRQREKNFVERNKPMPKTISIESNEE